MLVIIMPEGRKFDESVHPNLPKQALPRPVYKGHYKGPLIISTFALLIVFDLIIVW